ncbi:MAG: hypothetical protein WBD20_18850 [Pirellulaceae bacterium]
MANISSDKIDPPKGWLGWLLFVAIGLLLAHLTGRLSPHFVNDSVSYLKYDFGSADSIARAIRTPGYPFWLWLFKSAIGIDIVPAAQVIVHATAAFCLFRELTHWGLSRANALLVGVSVGIGCTAADNISTIAADALAASIGVFVIARLLCWARQGSSWQNITLIVASVTAAIQVRPAYLFLIPWVFLAGTILRAMTGPNQRPLGETLRSASFVASLCVIPLLGWMTFRHVAVSDFGVLPFGHQNLAAILVQLLDDEELQSLPKDSTAGKLGQAIVETKNRYDREFGFEPGEFGATMTIDSRWDEMTYFVVVPAAVEIAGDDTISYHHAIADLNKAIVTNYPLRYLKWLAKSARRGAWSIAANIVMHPVFLAGIALASALMLYRAVYGNFASVALADSVAFRALTIVTFSYLIAKLGFVILTTPAIGRFSDAAAILLPGWIGAFYLRWWFSTGKDLSDSIATKPTS